jgi:hypothetical protein
MKDIKKIEYIVLSFVVIISLFMLGYISRGSIKCTSEIIEKEKIVEVEKKVVEKVDNSENITNLCRYAKIYRDMYWYFTVNDYKMPREDLSFYNETGDLLRVSDELNNTTCK